MDSSVVVVLFKHPKYQDSNPLTGQGLLKLLLRVRIEFGPYIYEETSAI